MGIELKEGKVNDEVMALLSKAGEISVEDRQRIETTIGPDAVKQLDRAIRQDQRNRQVETLIRDERGVDPVSGKEIVIGDLTHVEVEGSHKVLEELLREALASPTHETLRLVDGCLSFEDEPALESDHVAGDLAHASEEPVEDEELAAACEVCPGGRRGPEPLLKRLLEGQRRRVLTDRHRAAARLLSSSSSPRRASSLAVMSPRRRAWRIACRTRLGATLASMQV